MITLSKYAINQAIMAFEVSWSYLNGFSVYTKKYSKPVVPDPANTSSGVTIGIGYDCGQYSAAKILKDWSSVIPLDQATALSKTAGLQKQKAVAALAFVKHISIPIEAALQVFYNNTLFEFAKIALKIYPALPQLHPVEQTVIISIVYNRGADLTGPRRKEMRDLIQAIKDDSDKEIADTIKAMCRLWPDTLGLRLRRQKEAELVLLPDIPIDESDKLVLNI